MTVTLPEDHLSQAAAVLSGSEGSGWGPGLGAPGRVATDVS